MPITTKRGQTRLTSFQLCNRFMEQVTAAFAFMDMQSFTLAAGSNCAANTTTEISVPVKNCALLDNFNVSPTFAMPAGLTISHAYCSVASSGSTSPQNPAGETAGTMKIRFANSTGAIIDAAGIYSYLQLSQTAGKV